LLLCLVPAQIGTNRWCRYRCLFTIS